MDCLNSSAFLIKWAISFLLHILYNVLWVAFCVFDHKNHSPLTLIRWNNSTMSPQIQIWPTRNSIKILNIDVNKAGPQVKKSFFICYLTLQLRPMQGESFQVIWIKSYKYWHIPWITHVGKYFSVTFGGAF